MIHVLECSTSDTSNLERIWQEHTENKTVLCAYADAMHHLAVDHWTKNQGMVEILTLTLYHMIPTFYDSQKKTLLEKEKILETSIFSFSHDVFYLSFNKYNFFI